MYEYNVTVIRIIDGDTVYLNVDMGFHASLVIDCRLEGINAPELHGTTKEAGLASKAELERTLSLGPLRVKTTKSDSFGRWLGRLFVNLQDGTILDVNDHMLSTGFAVPYP